MKLSKFIRQLLSENETVIFPDLGAFITEYKPSHLNEETSELMPPSREVTFNSKIRSNDGLLMDFIAHNEHISAQEALQKIEKEREEILYQLDKGEEVEIKGIGGLVYDENRTIRFLRSEKELSVPEAFGLEKLSLKKEPEEISEEKEEPIPLVNLREAGKETETEPQEKPEPIVAETPSEVKPEAEPKKKRRNLWWLLLLLILLIIAAIFLFKKTKQEPPVPVKTSIEQTVPEEVPAVTTDSVAAGTETVAATDSVVEDTTTVVAQDPGKPEDIQHLNASNIIQPDSTKFYLIGGSFADAKNAEKYFQQMKSKGYEPFHLEKQGNFFLVGIDIYDNKREAYGAQYNFLDRYPDSGVWVFIPE